MIGMEFAAMVEQPVNNHPLLPAELRRVLLHAPLAFPVNLLRDGLVAAVQEDGNRILAQVALEILVVSLRITEEPIIDHLLEWQRNARGAPGLGIRNRNGPSPHSMLLVSQSILTELPEFHSRMSMKEKIPEAIVGAKCLSITSSMARSAYIIRRPRRDAWRTAPYSPRRRGQPFSGYLSHNPEGTNLGRCGPRIVPSPNRGSPPAHCHGCCWEARRRPKISQDLQL